MEGKVSKIGLVILVVMVAARFLMSDEQKSDLSSLFERGDSENIVSRIFNGVIESDLLVAGAPFNMDYSSIEKRTSVNPVTLIQTEVSLELEIEDEVLASDYSSNENFEMFTYLNSDDLSDPDPETEPLEAHSTINATMDLFFPRR